MDPSLIQERSTTILPKVVGHINVTGEVADLGFEPATYLQVLDLRTAGEEEERNLSDICLSYGFFGDNCQEDNSNEVKCSFFPSI
jgi:hypothetical protein